MDPSSLVFGIDFSPDVILRIPDPSHATTHCSAQHAEAVGPFTNTATSRLKKRPYVGVSWEAFKSTTCGFGTPI